MGFEENETRELGDAKSLSTAALLSLVSSKFEYSVMEPTMNASGMC
jgi:hypothetical protein